MWWPDEADLSAAEDNSPRAGAVRARVMELWPQLLEFSPSTWGIGRRRTDSGDVIVVAVDRTPYLGFKRHPDGGLLDPRPAKGASPVVEALRRRATSAQQLAAGMTIPLAELSDEVIPPLLADALVPVRRIFGDDTTVEVLLVPPPESVARKAAARIGSASAGSDSLGTVGPPLTCHAHPAEHGRLIMTAGHVFRSEQVSAAVGLPARIFKRRLLGLRQVGTAQVRWSLEPDEEAGYDYAIASLSPPFSVPVDIDSAVGPPHVPINRNAHIRRGRGPSRQGYVTDTVLDLVRGRGDIDGRQWCRCWLVTGRGGVAAERGDSGSAVVLDDGMLLGHVVAATGWGFSQQEMCLVQDSWSVLDDARTRCCSGLDFAFSNV